MGFLRHSVIRFAKAKEGAVSLLLAIGLPGFIAVVAGAVDYSAVQKSQSRLQAAADATALSIAREMTLSPMTPDRVQALANAYALANIGSETSGLTAQGQLAEGGLAVKVLLTAPVQTPLGFIQKMTGVDVHSASALARVSTSAKQTKLCILSLGEHTNGGIFMHNNSRITAPDCMLHSNSTQSAAVIIQNGSKLSANMVCARGGISNLAGMLDSTLLTDCPVQNNPLVNKPEPAVNGPCMQNKLTIKSGLRTLSPGVYCQGVTIEGSARVQLDPGVYVFRDGPLVVRGDAELTGAGVTLMLAGKRGYFRFLDRSLIRLSAPNSGVTAGMLLWESKAFVKGLNSWQNGGCGGNGNDDDDDRGNNNCTVVLPGVVPPKKTNEHHINSDRAREMTGTIYLRNGLLLIDSRMPVADQSPFTVFVVNKLDIYDGPNLVVNSNFSGATVPVPSGLGPLGGRNIRLGM